MEPVTHICRPTIAAEIVLHRLYCDRIMKYIHIYLNISTLLNTFFVYQPQDIELSPCEQRGRMATNLLGVVLIIWFLLFLCVSVSQIDWYIKMTLSNFYSQSKKVPIICKVFVYGHFLKWIRNLVLYGLNGFLTFPALMHRVVGNFISIKIYFS